MLTTRLAGHEGRLDIFMVCISLITVGQVVLKRCGGSPFARFGVFPIGGRSTAIKLKSGDVWVLASTPLDDDTKTKLKEIGPVKCVFAAAQCHAVAATDRNLCRWIIGADSVHHLFLGTYAQFALRVVAVPSCMCAQC